MKKIQFLAVMALFMTFGCSNEDLINTEQDSDVFEEGNLSSVNGERKNNPNNGVSSIWFFGVPIENSPFISDCFPEGLNLLKQGYFSGKITGYGKINTSLSTYEFSSSSCEKLPSDLDPIYDYDPEMYAVEALGTLVLGPRDYCNITITGNVYTFYSVGDGYYSGSFVGNAIFSSGVGKLKDFDNKNFSVGQDSRFGRINLETGIIPLHIHEWY